MRDQGCGKKKRLLLRWDGRRSRGDAQRRKKNCSSLLLFGVHCTKDELIWPQSISFREVRRDTEKTKDKETSYRETRRVYRLQGCDCPDMISKSSSFTYSSERKIVQPRAGGTRNRASICVSRIHYLIACRKLSKLLSNDWLWCKTFFPVVVSQHKDRQRLFSPLVFPASY